MSARICSISSGFVATVATGPIVNNDEIVEDQTFFSEDTAVLGRVDDGDSSNGADIGVAVAHVPDPGPREFFVAFDDRLLERADRGAGGKAALARRAFTPLEPLPVKGGNAECDPMTGGKIMD